MTNSTPHRQHFEPKLEILPAPQLRLWPELKDTPSMFTLYGGTALALHYGHRDSVDFDFFSNFDFDPMELKESVPYLQDALLIRTADNTLECRVDRGGPVLVSFFGGRKLQKVEQPFSSTENDLAVASPRDVLATKLNTIQKRGSAKDYIDIAAGLNEGWTLEQGCEDAISVWGYSFEPMTSLKALCSFNDIQGDPLPQKIQEQLHSAVYAVDLSALPSHDRGMDL
ncbi:MAG: hypothetical protein CMK08_16405 [Ponticaulis sp.]|nr:hypothetical protein [Ponticaulis sp.]MBN04112.1 hypothetical protein [Ponticaulis sp.]MBN05746.1 hypothetical protein [Ponticaulis sp.]